MKKKIEQEYMTGERALFQKTALQIVRSTFADGESPLKESSNIDLYESTFQWKYPLWYSKDILLKDCTLLETARAGIWYTKHISIEDSIIEAPKTFRRSHDITLKRVMLANAAETLWNCEGIVMEDVTIKGDYFAMNSRNMVLNHVTLVGNYSFDGVKHLEIRNSKLLSKDAFWNAEDVTVYDSYISGEYLGWNAKSVKFVNCTVESNQGMCYMENLIMENCHFINTKLAFEYSSVEIETAGRIDSVFNPASGSIRAGSIGELIMEETKVEVGRTKIISGEALKNAV